MKIQIALAAGLLLALSGCAASPCRKYPAACAVAGAVVVGSIAACIAANQGNGRVSAVPPVRSQIVDMRGGN